MKIDINCDIGEHFGIYKLGNDRDIMPYITSVNIACGFHAGDPNVMYDTVKAALSFKLKIGAHPGFMDKEGFGRRNIAVSEHDVYCLVLYQIGALDAVVKAKGGILHHVKPHGALYNMAAENRRLADAISKAILDYNPHLKLFGLPNSELSISAAAHGVHFLNEIFADRNIGDDGKLVPRTSKDAIITDVAVSADHLGRILKTGYAKTLNGNLVPMHGDTICVHGDQVEAVAFAQNLKRLLDGMNHDGN